MEQRAGSWADRMAELCGAASLGGGVGASVWLCAPHAAALVGGAAALGGLVGWAIVRAAPGVEGRTRALPDFNLDPITEVVVEKPSGSAMLLDDPVEPAESSRVVQLFDPPVGDTPGGLQARTAAHLATPARDIVRPDGESPAARNGSPAIPDASDALHAALDEIRRSLRSG